MARRNHGALVQNLPPTSKPLRSEQCSENLHPVRELAHAPIHPPLPPPPPYHPLDVLVTIEMEGRGHLSHLSILTLMGLFLIGA